MISVAEIAMRVDRAVARIQPYLPPTPVIQADRLGRELGATLLLKLETLQPTRSFKVRGAFSKLTSLSAEERARGVVTASTGNHGLAVAYAAAKMGCAASVYLPAHASAEKCEAVRRYGSDVVQGGADVTEASQCAFDDAWASGRTYMSPYNDIEVLAGQGSIASELLAQVDRFDNIFVAMGGGGLISGIGACLKAYGAKSRILGCSAANSAALFAAMRAGRVVEVEHRPTWAEALAGSIEPDTITLPISTAVVDESIVCDESDIEAAVVEMLVHERILVEGAAAVTLAAYRKVHKMLRGQTSVLVLCGANVEGRRLADALCRSAMSVANDS
jgi:threonine dehydratase